MGLFDFRKRSDKPEPLNPEQLWAALFQAAAVNDAGTVERLCRAHRDAIVQHFPTWQTVPEEHRKDPAAVQQRIQALLAVAQCFVSHLHDPSLLQRLMGPPESNPIVQWKDKLNQARELMNGLRYAEAAQLLADVLIDTRQLEGSGVDHYLPLTLGHLGECYFQQGQAAQALPHLEQALRRCEQAGDADGVAVYLGNVYECHRYLGQPGPAADRADQLAAVLRARGKEDEAERYRRLAELVRAGEPLNRIIVTVHERQYELSDLPVGGDLRVKFAFQRNRPSLRPTQVHTSRGDQLGAKGDYDAALDAFREAARADPFDPHPHYEAGLTLLCLQRYSEAINSYEASEERAPGWFHGRADLWLARRLLLGKAEHPLFLALRHLEDGQGPPPDKLRLAEQVLAVYPDVSLLHLFRGKNMTALGRLEEAAAAYRSGLQRADEPNVRTRLLTELGAILSPSDERIALLRQAVELNGDLVAAAMAFVSLKCAEAAGTA